MKSTEFFFKVLFVIFLYGAQSIDAASYPLKPNSDIVGEILYVKPQSGETLSTVGIRYGIGYYEMVRANPMLDPVRPLLPKTRIIIPSQFILPQVQREGLVINLAEYRLYYFPVGGQRVITMPVGIGREGWTTPIGQTRVTKKEQDPVWHPTANVRAEAARNGTPIPNIFPPGDGNPLGRHVLRLGWPTYLIHGTNLRDGVGSRVSAGCIRMMPEDIQALYNLVPVGASVQVINEPIKFGRFNNRLYVQIRPQLVEYRAQYLSMLMKQQSAALGISRLNKKILKEELNYPTGIPRPVDCKSAC